MQYWQESCLKEKQKLYLCMILTIMSLSACMTQSELPFEEMAEQLTSRVETQKIEVLGPDGKTQILQRPHIIDSYNRYIHIRGINVSGSHKAPPTENFPSRYPIPEELAEDCTAATFPWDEATYQRCVPSQEVSYIGRPFPEGEIDRWYDELAKLGFNSVRLITNWESIQPYRPGSDICQEARYQEDTCFDLDYLDYYETVIRKAKDHGIYVLLDMHQDMFSRHLMNYYNENPSYTNPEGEEVTIERGTLESYLFSLLPPYTDWARGHGAPRWIVETCLPEKNLDSPYWGLFRSAGTSSGDWGASVTRLLNRFNPGAGPAPWQNDFIIKMNKQSFEPNETSDFMPLTPWLISGVLSIDVDRCFASLFAGDKVFPNLKVDADGKTKRINELQNPEQAVDLKAYLQGHYEQMWRELARRAKNYDHVIGYDIMNEPVGAFLMLTISSLYSKGLGEMIEPLLGDLLGEMGTDIFEAIEGLNLLPVYDELEDCSILMGDEAETCEVENQAHIDEVNYKWGMIDEIDLGTAFDLNLGVDADYLQPFYERMGKAIQEEDPQAIIWFENSTSLRILTGAMSFWDRPLTRPQGINQLVFAPHWYPDIYPRLGIGSPPREFNDDEWLYRDFEGPLHEEVEKSRSWLGNVPVVLGEFGTYFNFNGIENSKDNDYLISSHVLNSYYEALESLGLGNMIWCFSAENDYDYGELWNHEDFSVIDPNGEARSWKAFVRPYARSMSGKLIHQRFYSPYHFWDPTSGVAPPERRFELIIELKESEEATEVFIPRRQYPEGFYVWLSDGQAFYDEERQMLYWYPHQSNVGTEHRLVVQPALSDRSYHGWRYYYQAPILAQDEKIEQSSGGEWLVGMGDFSNTYALEMWP